MLLNHRSNIDIGAFLMIEHQILNAKETKKCIEFTEDLINRRVENYLISFSSLSKDDN